tara:strand:- start:272 stop:631 length:360 start_codon:yes stop_codon:yes gene_type:complete
MTSLSLQHAEKFLAGARNLEEYLGFFADDCTYKVGNNPTIAGKEALEQSYSRFKNMVDRVEHEILSSYESKGNIVVELNATYHKKDGSAIKITCLDLFIINDQKIKSLQVFADLSPLFK